MTSRISTDRKETGMDRGQGEVLPTIQERMAAEERVKERVDEEGNLWTKVYFGGGEHFRNWLEQCRELGEVMVEPVDATGYKCFEQGGETLYRIWMKMDQTREEELL
jgi:hypothetical protein